MELYFIPRDVVIETLNRLSFRSEVTEKRFEAPSYATLLATVFY
jgi:hypothetical protein